MKAALAANWPFPRAASGSRARPVARSTHRATSARRKQVVRVVNASDLSIKVSRVGTTLEVVACGLLTAETLSGVLREITTRRAAKPFLAAVFDMRKVVNCLSAAEVTNCAIAEFRRSGRCIPVAHLVSEPDHESIFDHCELSIWHEMSRAVFLAPSRAFAWAARRTWDDTEYLAQTEEMLEMMRQEWLPRPPSTDAGGQQHA